MFVSEEKYNNDSGESRGQIPLYPPFFKLLPSLSLKKRGQGRFSRMIAKKIPLFPPLAKGDLTNVIPKECFHTRGQGEICAHNHFGANTKKYW